MFVYFHPYLGIRSNLTSLFFKWVAQPPPRLVWVMLLSAPFLSDCGSGSTWIPRMGSWKLRWGVEKWPGNPEVVPTWKSFFPASPCRWHFLVQLVVRSFTIFQGFATTARDTTSSYDSWNFPAEVMQKPNSLCQSAVHSKRFLLLHNLPFNQINVMNISWIWVIWWPCLYHFKGDCHIFGVT